MTDTVYDYFEKQLGSVPNDETLRGLPCGSNCGHDCCQMIDAAFALLSICDPSPNVRFPILEGVERAISIAWHG